MFKTLLFLIVSISLYASILIVNGENFALDIEENLTISGDITIDNNATLTSGEDSYINLNKDWKNFGNFIASTSTVNFTGITSSTINGETKFYNFKSTKNLTFESDKTQEIIHIFEFKNAEINSTDLGVLSTINLATVNNIDTENLIVKDSKIIGRVYALNPKNSIDRGNTIMWFSQDPICQNIGSGYKWVDKLECQDKFISYQIKKDTYHESKIITKKDIDITVNFIDTNNTLEEKRVEFSYTSPVDAGIACKKNVNIVLNEDATVKTGFKGCKEDPTLKNWNMFKDAKVFIDETTLANSHSVIVIDVNLSSKLVIGGER